MNNKVVIPEFTSGVISMTLAGDATNTLALAPRIDIKSIPGSSNNNCRCSLWYPNMDGP